MIRLSLLLIISGAITFSCSRDRSSDEVISEEGMSLILLDIYISENELSNLGMNRDTTVEIFKKYEKLIFERNNIDEEKYRKSLTYYYDHPDMLEKIYDIVLDSLTLRESKIKARMESERLRKDSVKLATDTLKVNEIEVTE